MNDSLKCAPISLCMLRVADYILVQSQMLKQLNYDPNHDTIFFAGDLLAKSSHSSSLSVLSFLTEHHIHNGAEKMFPVRGNHDQLIVQWRAWREWFEGLILDTYAASQPPRRFSVARFLAPDRLVPSLLRRLFATSAAPDSAPPASTGREFLQLLEAEWAIARIERDADPEEYADVARKRAEGTWREEWWRRVPQPGKGRAKQQWSMFGDHYWLARYTDTSTSPSKAPSRTDGNSPEIRDMTQEQANYLFSLPLVLHVPHLHFFVAHAGLLPSDPRLPPTDRSQPLAHAPTLAQKSAAASEHAAEDDRVLLSRLQAHLLAQESSADSSSLFTQRRPSRDLDTRALGDLRRAQESAILSDVPQNRDPWVVLNMRSVTKKHKVTRNGDKGTPWSKLWNRDMDACRGFDAGVATRPKPGDYELPCRPATVVYGHAATRGLDVKRWSMGLDTGCLYGRKLTALVLSNATNAAEDDSWFGGGEDEDEDEDEEDEDDDDDDDGEADSRPKRKRVQFGDPDSGINARLVGVECPNMDDDED